MAGLLDGIMPMITNVVPILGMLTGDEQGDQGGGSTGSKDPISSVLDMLGLGDILSGFGLGGDTTSTKQDDKDTTSSTSAKPSKSSALDAVMSALGGGDGASGGDAKLAAAALAAAGTGGSVPTEQPREQAGTPIGGMLPPEMTIPIIPM
jgi:hypothetical protein